MSNQSPDARSRFKLDQISEKIESSPSFDKLKHDSESRLSITKLFLIWYFSLIAGSFIFSAAYNFLAAYINLKNPNNPINYLDVSNTVSIITTTLSSGVGFVIGYYFKNSNERE
jgi:hypothetical protein